MSSAREVFAYRGYRQSIIGNNDADMKFERAKNVSENQTDNKSRQSRDSGNIWYKTKVEDK
jgi:hypothetical protein